MRKVSGLASLSAGLVCVGALAAAAPRADAAATIRQVFPTGSQETFFFGVKLTSGGGTTFGTPATLQQRMGGGWVCGGTTGGKRIVTWRGTVRILLTSLQFDPPCDPANTAVGAIELRGRGQALQTGRGVVVVGQKWTSVPKGVQALVTSRRGNALKKGRVLGLGTRQTSCGVAPPAGTSDPLVYVALTRITERVSVISTTLRINEGVDCG